MATTTGTTPTTTTTTSMIVCFFFLGSSAWVLVNGIYAQIPIITSAFDNDYSIISKITLCVTLTSIAPIMWSILLSSTTKTEKEEERPSNNTNNRITNIGITLILILGTATSFSLSISDAALHQTSLLVVSVCSGIIGTMSRVLYFPHAATTTMIDVDDNTNSPPPTNSTTPQALSAAVRQTTSMASGMAAASLFVAVLAIVQQMNYNDDGDDDHNPSSERFSMQAYFGILSAIFGLAIIGFIGTVILSSSPSCHPSKRSSSSRNERHVHDNEDEDDPANEAVYGSIEIPSHLLSLTKAAPTTSEKEQNGRRSAMATPTSHISSALDIHGDDGPPHDEDEEHQHTRQSTLSLSFWHTFWDVSRRHSAVNGGQFVLNALTFFLPGTVPYSVQHFDNSQRALHFLTVTQLIAQTCGTITSGWRQWRSVSLQLTIFVLLWIPTVTLSFVNDTDFQHANQTHSAVPITLNALLNFLYGYSSTTFYHLVHARDNDDPHVASRVLGSWNQLGAMLGSLIAYFLVTNGAI
jgi:hypothetical protein